MSYYTRTVISKKESKMSHIEHIRLPEHVHTAIHKNSEGNASNFISKTLQEFVDGTLNLVIPSKPGTKNTCVTMDDDLSKQVKEYAKSKGLSFSKALVLMLEQKLNLPHR
jgi:hypothetical protein